MMADPFWRDRAACLNVGPEIFFVRTKAEAEPAIQLCEGCPVRKQCAEAGMAMRLTSGVHAGVWFGDRVSGGTIARARKELEAVAGTAVETAVS